VGDTRVLLGEGDDEVLSCFNSLADRLALACHAHEWYTKVREQGQSLLGITRRCCRLLVDVVRVNVRGYHIRDLVGS
jgi:hypothetical protein